VITAFEAQEASGLLDFEEISDETAGRGRVDADEVAALVVLPAGFSRSVLPLAGLVQDELGLDVFEMTTESIQALPDDQQQALGRLYLQSQEMDQPAPVIEIYASPDYEISASVVQGVLRAVLEQMNVTTAGVNAIVSRLIAEQVMTGTGGGAALPEAITFAPEDFNRGAAESLPIQLDIVSPSGRSFSWLDYSATSMAVLFLMFAVTSGGWTLLAERQMGTLPRLAVTPTGSLTILLGKTAGVVLTGLLQVGVLWGATSLIGAYWGPPPAVAVALLALVLGATGVGTLISAWANSAGQASAIGSTVTLVAAAASGSFLPRTNLPAALQTVSFITPNAWGVEIFLKLQFGGSLETILPLVGGLLALTVVYFAIAAVGFRRHSD
jgi:ABC-2 type transport system permease protein